MKPTDSAAALLAAIKALDQPDKVPDGWLNSDQLASSWRVDRSTVQKRLRKATAAGMLEVRGFRIDRSGRIAKVQHYKIK